MITRCRSVLSTLKEHRSIESCNSRILHRIDKIVQYKFSMEQMPGTKTGLVDYISRNSIAKAKKVSMYNKHFLVATISKVDKFFESKS